MSAAQRIAKLRAPLLEARDRSPASWVRLVRDPLADFERAILEAPRVSCSDQVAALVAPRLAAEVCEVMLAVLVDARQRVLALSEVARGGSSGLSVTRGELFRCAIAQGARGLILAHNHPSGHPSPSPEDDLMTSAVHASGELIAIPLLDHLVIGGRARFVSYADTRRGPFS